MTSSEIIASQWDVLMKPSVLFPHEYKHEQNISAVRTD